MSEASIRFADPLAQDVHRALWEDWDPLAMNGVHTDDREYADYVPEISRSIAAGANASELAQLLGQIREGWGDEADADLRVARHLLAFAANLTAD